MRWEVVSFSAEEHGDNGGGQATQETGNGWRSGLGQTKPELDAFLDRRQLH